MYGLETFEHFRVLNGLREGTPETVEFYINHNGKKRRFRITFGERGKNPEVTKEDVKNNVETPLFLKRYKEYKESVERFERREKADRVANRNTKRNQDKVGTTSREFTVPEKMDPWDDPDYQNNRKSAPWANPYNDVPNQTVPQV